MSSHRTLALAALLLLALALPARADDPPAGIDVTVDWTRFRDLETLVGRVESEGFVQDKKKLEPVARLSWGKALPILPPADLVFPADKPDREAELAFLAAYLLKYRETLTQAGDAAIVLAGAQALLPDPCGPFPAFARQFASRYKLDALALAPNDPEPVAGKKRAAAEILRFALRQPEWEKEFAPLLDAKPDELAKEWDRRLAEAKKLVKRFDIGKDVGTGELAGTSVFDVKLGPVGLEFTKNAVGNLRTSPVVDASGKPWSVDGQPLLVCSEKTLPDVNSYVKDIRQEYVLFRYRQIGFADEKTKDVIRLVCARLYLGTRYFLFYRDRVILFTKDRPGK